MPRFRACGWQVNANDDIMMMYFTRAPASLKWWPTISPILLRKRTGELSAQPARCSHLTIVYRMGYNTPGVSCNGNG